MVYKVNSKTARAATKKNPVTKNNHKRPKFCFTDPIKKPNMENLVNQ